MKVHRPTLRRVWEAGWRPLAGVEDCVQRREKEKEEEEGEESSPLSFSSDTSDIAESLE